MTWTDEQVALEPWNGVFKALTAVAEHRHRQRMKIIVVKVEVTIILQQLTVMSLTSDPPLQ